MRGDGALSGSPIEVSVGHQTIDRPPDRHPGELESLLELSLRRDRVVGGEVRGHQLQQDVAELGRTWALDCADRCATRPAWSPLRHLSWYEMC
jgi:hypothetical protein